MPKLPGVAACGAGSSNTLLLRRLTASIKLLPCYQALCACDQGQAITLPIPPGAYTYAGTNGAVRCNNAAFKLAFPASPAIVGAGDTLSVCALAPALRLARWGHLERAGRVGLGGDGLFLHARAPAGWLYSFALHRPAQSRFAPVSRPGLPQHHRKCRRRGPARNHPDSVRCGRPAAAAGAAGWRRLEWAGRVGLRSGGVFFTPTPALVGTQTLGYTGPQPSNPVQCPASGTIQVEVLAVPNVQIDPVKPINFCLTAPPHGVVLTATPVGGVFSGPGVVANRFNPATVGPGRYPITYTWSYPEFGLSCPITTTRTVEVILVPVPTPIDTLLCASGTVQLRSHPAGGVWTGPGVSAGGLLTVPTAPGTIEVLYTLPDGCAPQVYRLTVPAENSTIARWSAPLCAANYLAPYYVRFEATGSRAA